MNNDSLKSKSVPSTSINFYQNEISRKELLCNKIYSTKIKHFPVLKESITLIHSFYLIVLSLESYIARKYIQIFHIQ